MLAGLSIHGPSGGGGPRSGRSRSAPWRVAWPRRMPSGPGMPAHHSIWFSGVDHEACSVTIAGYVRSGSYSGGSCTRHGTAPWPSRPGMASVWRPGWLAGGGSIGGRHVPGHGSDRLPRGRPPRRRGRGAAAPCARRVGSLQILPQPVTDAAHRDAEFEVVGGGGGPRQPARHTQSDGPVRRCLLIQPQPFEGRQTIDRRRRSTPAPSPRPPPWRRRDPARPRAGRPRRLTRGRGSAPILPGGVPVAFLPHRLPAVPHGPARRGLIEHLHRQPVLPHLPAVADFFEHPRGGEIGPSFSSAPSWARSGKSASTSSSSRRASS